MLGLKPPKKISLDDYCLAAAIHNCEPFRQWLALAKLDKKTMTVNRWSDYRAQYLSGLAGLAAELDNERQ